MTVSEKEDDQGLSESAVKGIAATEHSLIKQPEGTGAEEKRTYKRINVRIDVRFFYGGQFFSGTVTQISANGMFIHTRIRFPLKAHFDVLLKVKDRIIKVPASIAGRRGADRLSAGIGVKVLHTSGEYLELLMRSNGDFLT